MSRNAQKNPSPAPPAPVARSSRRGLFVAAGAAALAAVAAGTYFAMGRGGAPAVRPGLASDHAPTLGPSNAKVHIVEFLDPACETCAAFYPLVKRMLADNPDKIRLSVRHVPFHRGSEDVVRMLEASRKQDKYWQTLETLLAKQALWAPNHTAQPALARQAIAGVGLDMERLAADMAAPEVGQRMALDSRDAALLQVIKTPEYFVNGRQMASFGRQQLQDLVRGELKRAY